MQENSLYAFAALIIPVLIGRFLLHKSLTEMPTEKKQAIDESIKVMQRLRYLAIFVIVGSIYFLPEATYIIFPIFIIVMSWVYWAKVSKVNPPKHYTFAFFSSMILGIIGIGAFLFLQQGKLF